MHRHVQAFSVSRCPHTWWDCGAFLQLREELTNARGINECTADETTKLLLEASRLQQDNVALKSDVLHKEEMLRILINQIR